MRNAPTDAWYKTANDFWTIRMVWTGGNALTLQCDALSEVGAKIAEMSDAGQKFGLTEIQSITVK